MNSHNLKLSQKKKVVRETLQALTLRPPEASSRRPIPMNTMETPRATSKLVSHQVRIFVVFRENVPNQKAIRGFLSIHH